MTRDELKRYFPNATASTLALADDTGAPAKLEPNPRASALEQGEAEALHTGRVLVRVTSVRKRLLDADNLCEKYHVDCLRYAGFLQNDSPAEVEIETRQRKAAKGEEECVTIELFAI